MKKLMCTSLMLAAIIVAPSAVDAAPKSGCPATPGTPTRWQRTTVDFVGNLIYTLDYVDSVDDGVAEITQRFDRNGDRLVCLATRWENLNPNSKWFGNQLYIVADNNANATK